MKHLKLFFALFAMLALGVGNAWGADDVIDYSTTKSALNSTATSTWKSPDLNITGASGAQYVIHSMGTKGTSNALQWNKNGFLYQTKSGGTLKSVTINGTSGKKVNIYASKSAYSGAASGTAIATLNLTGSDATYTFDENSNYTYLAINGSLSSTSIVSITVTYETASATPDPVDPTVTFSNGNYTVGGTLNLSTLWTSNSDGAVTYTVKTDGGTGATINGTSFTATAAGTCEIKASQAATSAYNAIEKTATITITAPTPATITLSEAGVETSVSGKNVGDSYTLPLTSTQTCGTKTFVGWSTVEIATPGDKPITNFHEPGAPVTLAATQTFYAVYATSSGTPETWEQTTSVAVGDLVVIAQVDNGTKEMTGLGKTPETANNNYGVGTDFTTNPNGTLIWTVEEGNTSGQFSFNNGTYYLNLGANENYLSYSATKTATSSWTVSTSDERAVVTNANYDSRKIMWNKNNTRFASYSKNHGNNSGQYYYHIVFYKKSGGISYSDYTTSCAAAPKPAELVSIAANAEGKNAFTEGDEFVKATITATYDDETTKDVTSLATFTGYDMNTTGTQTVTVTYEGQTTTYQITVNAKTPATLILSKNGVEEALEGEHKVGDVVTLPSITSDCVKQFVGWSADDNCATAPEYAPGADFTLTAEEHTLYAVYATAAEGELTSIFSETFDACDGTGGNDGKWSGTGVAQGDLPDELSSTWTFIKGTKANECAKFGTGSLKGSAETPEIALSGSAKLTFKSGAWDGNSEKTTLNVSATGATLSPTSVTLDKGIWNAYTIDITEATGSVKIKFEAVVDDNNRFFLDDVVVSQGSITYSDYSTTCTVAPDAPEFSVATGTYNAAQTVTITAEDGATIYYTLNGNNPTNESNVYSSALTISETTTLKAIAVKDGLSSAIATATYTIKLPLTTIDQIFAKATEVGGTATAVEITMGGWTVSGANDKNVFVTDGTKGFIIYKSDGGHGFNVGDVLSGTVACKVQLFKGSAELTELTSTTSGLTVTTGGTVAPVTLDAAGITALTGVNTGSVIKINGTCTLENSKYYVAGVQLYNTLYEFQTLEPSAEYNVTGVYQLYTTTKEILPRQEADIEKIESLPTATISIADITMEVEETKTITATIYPAAAAAAVVYSTTSSCISISGNTITALTEGTATVTATIADSDDKHYGATKDFTVTVTPKSTKDKVVILAEYDGQWYAMKGEAVSGKTGQIAAIPVTYVDGKLYDVADADRATIEWQRAVVDDKTTFSNNGNFLNGEDGTNLTLVTTKGEGCSWIWNPTDKYYTTNTSGTIRTFIYRENFNFKNYDVNSAGTTHKDGNYSKLPVVTAPVYVTGEVALTGKFSTGKYEYAQFAPGNLQYNVGSSTWAFAGEQYNVIGEPNINVGDPTFTGTIDMFGWSADGKFGVNPSNKNEDYIGGFQDWGTLFPVEHNYSTLSADQWYYLLFQRDKASSLKQIAKINGVVGILLFPDDWAGMPDGCTVGVTETEFTDDEGKIIIRNYEYTLEQWAKIEAEGAVFLPGAGRRAGGYGNKINYSQVEETNSANLNDGFYRWQDYTNYVPYYWTSTKVADNNVKYLTTYHVVSQDPLEYGVGYAHVGWGEYARYGQSVRLAKVTSTLIEIGGGDNSTVIADNEDEIVNVKVNRTFTANDGYYTICLPFDLAAEKIGKAYQIQAITEHVAGEGINVEFTEVNTLTAGQPYLLLPSKNLENPIFEGVTIVNTTGETTDPVVGAGIKITFTGIINGVGETTGSTDYYVGDYGFLYNGTTEKLGLRAFFTITDEEGNPAKVRARVVVGENTTTDLDNILNGENTTIKVIENGQLIIIRNGEKFNAQGVRF